MKISEKARTLLAEEYERHGKYPTYAQQAMTSDAEFTMCSLRAIERAMAPAQQVPGGGWKLVPVEPTSEMLVAALKTNGVCPQYAAMMAAAPQPPVGGDVEPVEYYSATRLKRPGVDAISSVTAPWIVVLADQYDAHVTARDQQITALQARVAELEKALRHVDKELSADTPEDIDHAMVVAALAQQVTKHD